jgi:hypothetical protein
VVRVIIIMAGALWLCEPENTTEIGISQAGLAWKIYMAVAEILVHFDVALGCFLRRMEDWSPL